MRKVLMALAMVGLVALGGSGAVAADDGADWLVAGTGTTVVSDPFTPAMLHVNAQSNVGGTSVRGHFWIRYPDGGGEFGGPIVCLNVDGKAALLYGRIENIKTPRAGFDDPTRPYVPIRVIDGGDPGTTFDLVNFDPGQAAPMTGCVQNSGYVKISQGNYVVHDKPVTDLLGLDQLLAQFESAANDPYG